MLHSGGNFSTGPIDLGGLQVGPASSFSNPIWVGSQGGADGLGISMHEPTELPEGFSMLGSISISNNHTAFLGWTLVAKDVSGNTNNPTLKKPVDYKLVWSSELMKIPCYIWLPMAPDGYKAIGHVATNTSDKPSLDKVMCVRSDFTDPCETSETIWEFGSFKIYDVRPSNRGIEAPGVRVGTFEAQNGTLRPPSIACLKNNNPIPNHMPNLEQVNAILKKHSPVMYLHPDEEYFPSSVEWFFSNGAQLHTKGQGSAINIPPNGSNLPQGGKNDGAYWIDLPADAKEQERVKKGNLSSAKSYVHVKPVDGGTYTDLAMWVFYPFNGPARAKVEFLNLNLGKIGEHVGDWEHVTLRVSNFNGDLKQMYFSEHNKGIWLDSSLIEYHIDHKPKYYSSLLGHASYPHPGLHLVGQKSVGIRNDTDKGSIFDLGSSFQVVAAEYLGSQVVEPPWLNYFREWGPKIQYDLDKELKKLENNLPSFLKRALENIVKKLPSELLGQEGPTGPKEKDNWNGDERT